MTARARQPRRGPVQAAGPAVTIARGPRPAAAQHAPLPRLVAGRAAGPAKALARARRAHAGESTQTLTEKAYLYLEEMIVTLELPPGSAVSETILSQRLGIGRTPIREALQRLARERLVIILPRRGVIVSEINVKAQLRLLEVRREVERLIARSAARRASPEEREHFRVLAQQFEGAAQTNDGVGFMRIDRDFNAATLAASRNEFAAGAMVQMQSLSRRYWYQHYQQAADMPAMAELHARVARAIADADSEAAAAASDALIDNIESFTRATVSTDY